MSTLRWDVRPVQRALLRALLRRDTLLLQTQQGVAWDFLRLELNLTTIMSQSEARAAGQPAYAQVYIYAMVHVDLFQTLADPTRRLIIESLQGSEQSVNDIVARVGIHQSGVSRHLRILHEAGFVQVRPEGVRRFYSLRPAIG